MPSKIEELASTAVESVESAASKLFDSETAAKIVDTVENKMLPYVIASASFVYGVVFPENAKTIESTKAVVPTNTGSTKMTFFYGTLFGMVLSHELYRNRVLDKMRLALFSWLYDSPDEEDAGEEKLIEKFREPVQLQELEGIPMPGSEKEDNSGILKELVSPDWALSPNLHVALLTLPFGAQLEPVKTKGVEFYYVIEGEGTYINYKLGEEPRDTKVSSGNGFLVDPGTCRGFSAKGRGPLVLLRATDTAIVEGYDVQTNTLSSSRALLSAGLGKIEELVKKYSQSEDFEVLKSSGN